MGSAKWWVSGGLIVLGVGVSACIGEIIESVHFNSAQPDFGAPPPPIVITAWGETLERSVPTQNGEARWPEYDEAAERAKAARIASLRSAVLSAEGASNWTAARAAYEALIAASEDPDEREDAADRIEVVDQNAKTPNPNAVTYLRARREILNAQAATREPPYPELDRKRIDAALATIREISTDPSAGWLRPHALYALAGAAYDAGNFEEAARIYAQVTEATDSPRRERALIMTVRCLLRGGEDTDPKPEAIAQARMTAATLLKDYPQTRFRQNALGWLARADFLDRRYPDAMRTYLRHLATNPKPEERALVLSSIRSVSEKLDAAGAARIQGMIKQEPELLAPYLDYRLYHTESRPSAIRGLVAFAEDVLRTNPRTPIPAEILARLAAAQYALGDVSAARSMADRSLATGTRDELALYVRGSSLRRTGDAAGAESAYEEVVKLDGRLTGAARENLALIFERAGRWGDALDQYRALDYRWDVAYLLDARIPLPELQKIAEARKGEKDGDLLRFSVGMRLLRQDRLADARAVFASIENRKRSEIGRVGSKDFGWVREDPRGLVDQVFDPLTTTDDLLRLRKAVSDAATDDAKARALYALASYYYERRNLLLYNAPLWEGARNSMFGFFWNTKVAVREDNLAVAQHHYEHEALFRARSICLELVRRYPKSSVADRALYRAATSSRRLADFNTWWRDRNRVQDMWSSASTLMDRVSAEYPRSPLAPTARKYAAVFREEGKGATQSLMFALTPPVN